MKPPSDARWFGFALLLAAAVLVVGLVVYMGFVAPRIDEMRQLEAACATLRTQLHEQAMVGREREELVRFLDLEGLSVRDDALQEDAITYLARLVKSAGLETLELTSGRGKRTVSSSAAPLGLTVRGRFARILDFVRTLEKSPRLVTVDAFSIEMIDEESVLEADFTVTVYDPKGGL